jgi:hypothetical protein
MHEVVIFPIFSVMAVPHSYIAGVFLRLIQRLNGAREIGIRTDSRLQRETNVLRDDGALECSHHPGRSTDRCCPCLNAS